MFDNIKNALVAIAFWALVAVYAIVWHYTLRFIALAVVWPYVYFLKLQARRAQLRYDEARDNLSEQHLENIMAREEFAHRFMLNENTPLFQYLVHQWYIYEDHVRKNVTDPLRDRYLDLDERIYKIRHRLR